MSRMSDAAILMDEMQGWTTDQLVAVWACSDDPAERYAASEVVRRRAEDALELETELLPWYGREHPEKMVESDL